MQVNTMSCSMLASYCFIDVTDDDNFGIYLEPFVQISLTSTSRRSAVNHDELVLHWGIHLDHAKAMKQHTTQQSVRMIANFALSRCFWTNDCLLWYRHLRHSIFADKMFSNMYSCWNNKGAQVFTSDFGWVQVNPMKTKGDVHEALSLIFPCEGIPPSMVIDGSKEQTLGKFCWKLIDACCQLKQTKPYSPWQNAAEREIKELKKGAYICSRSVYSVYHMVHAMSQYPYIRLAVGVRLEYEYANWNLK